MPDGPRYDDDYYAWTQYQAEVLRTMRRADNRLDRERVAEEIEDLASIVEARRALADKITSTLQRDAEAMLPELYGDARELADIGLRKFGEHAAARLPPICPYTLEQIRARGWYPKTPS